MEPKTLFFDEGTKSRFLLGGKGAGLHEMIKEGLPVPLGFTITTEAYREWSNDGIGPLEEEIRARLDELQQRTKNTFDSSASPLFVSVRSGAAVSMPGMMDTILNVGATDKSIDALAVKTDDSNFAYGVYKKFLEVFYKIKYGSDLNFQDAAKVCLSGSLHTLLLKSSCQCAMCIDSSEEKFFDELKSYHDPREFLYGKKDLIPQLSKEGVFKFLAGDSGFFKLTNSHVAPSAAPSHGYFDKNKQGKIAEINEDHLKIIWDSGVVQAIPWAEVHHHELTLFPQIFSDLSKYLEEKKTVGQLKADVKRARFKLDDIPTDPYGQVLDATEAVFKSWNSARAQVYRSEHDIADTLGTAVIVQRMVFGNMKGRSGTAVVFSSSPKNGTEGVQGEYLLNAQGEDLVSGRVTPKPLEELAAQDPEIYQGIDELARKIELNVGDIQDIEVTWESGKLYALQRRRAEVTPTAALNFLLRRYEKDDISISDFIGSINANEFAALTQQVSLDLSAAASPLAQGTSVLQGIMTGRIALSAHDISSLRGLDNIVYCSLETTTEDIAQIKDSNALLTIKGGAYSHAALVALSLKKLCVVGCGGVINTSYNSITFDDATLKSGDLVTIDGYTGKIYRGKVDTIRERQSPLVQKVCETAKQVVNDLLPVYEAQCLQDLEEITDKSSKVLYSIDFDCFESSGALQEQKLTSKERKERIEKQVSKVYAAFQKKPKKKPLLTVYGTFNSGLAGAGLNPDALHRWYLRMFSQRAQASGLAVSFVADPSSGSNVSKRFLRENKYQIKHSPQYQSGTGCVVIQPWDKEGSYLKAAQEVLKSGV